jgi:PAS domain S-box-containing protein
MVENVSNLKRLTQSLQKSELINKTLLELIPDLIFRVNRKGVFLDFIGAVDELHYQKEDFIGKTTDEVLPEETARLINEKIHLTLSTGGVQTFHYQFSIPGVGLQDYEARMVVFTKNEVISIVRNVTAERKNQKTILDNLANLRAIMEATEDVLILLEADGTIIESNLEHARRLGVNRDEIIGKNVFDLLPREIGMQRKAWIEQAIATQKVVHAEDVRAGIQNEIRIFPVNTEDGATKRVAVFARDVTLQKQLSEQLAESEKKYRTLFENLSQGIFFQAASGEVIDANRSALELFGLTRKQFLGIDSYDKRWKVVNELYEEIPADAHTSMKALATGKPVVNEIVGVWIPELNKYNWMIVTAIPQFRPGEQKPYQVFVSLQDINERHHFEEALHKSEELFALVIDASELGIWDWNLETEETYFSPQWKNQLGYSDNEVKNRFSSWVELLHPDEKEMCIKKVEDYLKKPYGHFIMQFRMKHRNGSYRWIHNKASSLKDSDGNVIRMFGAHSDITEKMIAENELQAKKNELEALNAQKDKFFSIIAHDLKSPFNSIMGFSELLIEQIKDEDYEGIEKYAEIILQSSNKAVNLLTNLLDWARSQTGRMVFNPEFFEIVDFIKEIIMLMEDAAGAKSIEITAELPHNIPVYADVQMIHTVLRNLISNAVKFTHPGGRITISAKAENNADVVVAVSDSGIGIPYDKIPLLFRIDENYSTKGTGNETGTGLGLILCREFIEKHGGTITVTSTEGQGSTFTFTLPHR